MSLDVRFTPESGHRQPHSITSLTRASSDGGTRQVECLRRFEIDDHFVFCRYLHRHIARLLPFEDTIDIAGACRYWSM